MGDMEKKKLKIALVHDFLVQRGGAERVLRALCDMYPEAPVYTLLYDKDQMGEMFADREVRVSRLDKLPRFLKKRRRLLLPLFAVAPETFDLREFDLVISSSGAWSKGVVTRLSSVHVAYIHSPMRFAWDYSDRYVSQIKEKKLSILARLALTYVRLWDRLAADRPDFLIANSEYTRKRIAKYYRRESVVVYPPVRSLQLAVQGTQQNPDKKGAPERYFLAVSRLSPYKHTDAIVEAFNKLKLPLVVIGTGEQEEKIRKMASSSVRVLGKVSDEELWSYYKNARALVFAAEEDFGMVAAESLLAATPVVALRSGGVAEIVEEGKTGEFFDAATPEVIADGVRRFLAREGAYDKKAMLERAAVFSRERFEKGITAAVEDALEGKNMEKERWNF